MLNQKDISEFEKVKSEITDLLEDNETIDVVPKRLYIDKDGTWNVRYDMSGASLGTPTPQELLRNFVWATAGFVASEDMIQDHVCAIFARLLIMMTDTLTRLGETKRQNGSS